MAKVVHLFFIVKYLDWPDQRIDITDLIRQNPGTTIASWRTFYTSNGYSILGEESSIVDEGGGDTGGGDSTGWGCLLTTILGVLVTTGVIFIFVL
jgi:hypothetical protein